MKILSIMCDMVRPNVLDFNNGYFENQIKKIGGTFFSNCYSPGPDTGRSMGCYWSGKNPQDNGCDCRAKYPKFYMVGKSFLDELEKDEYKFYFFTNPNEKVLGVLPNGFEKKGIHNDSLDLKMFVSDIDKSLDNIYVHIVLSDFHWALDDYGPNNYGVRMGLKYLSDDLNIIDKYLGFDDFDLVIIFSDHGFKYYNEFIKQPKYMFLNRDRSNILMFLHKKNDSQFHINNKLCSIVDIYPTLFFFLGKKCECYGIDMFSEQEHEYILAEDHMTMMPKIKQEIELWAMIKKETIIFIDKSGFYNETGLINSDKNEYINIFRTLKSFDEFYKQNEILKLYSTMANEKSVYSNGEKRYKSSKSFFRKLLKMLRNKMTKY